MKKEKALTPGRMVMNRFRRNKMAQVGFVIIVLMFAFAFIGPFFTPYGEGQIFLSEDGSEMLLYQAPSAAHPLGTDGRGMDLLTRLMYGGRVSLLIGFIVVAIETTIGVIMGGIAGYYGKWVDSLIMRLVDIFNCIPFMPVMLLIGIVMSGMQMSELSRIMILMIVMGILGWSYIARIVRGQILSLREQEYMMATEALGIPAWRRIVKHLVPNVVPQIIVIATMNLGGVILTESSLSFLGIGVRYPSASWGNMIEAITNEHIMSSYPFTWVPPGICILLTVLAFNFLGDGLRDAFDPKMKR